MDIDISCHTFIILCDGKNIIYFIVKNELQELFEPQEYIKNKKEIQLIKSYQL